MGPPSIWVGAALKLPSAQKEEDMLQSQEETVFNDREAQEMAFGQDDVKGLSVRFRVEERLNKLKSEGGVVRFDRWRDTANIERLKGELDALGIAYKESLNERDDTIDLKVAGAGRPIYDALDYIEIRSGDKTDIKDRPVSKHDMVRFGARYRAWKATKTNVVVGTPLTQWPGVTKSMVEELANRGIASVEQLSETPDEVLSRVGPIMGLKQRARDYLEASKGLAPLTQMRAENADLRNQVAALQAQMATVLAGQAKPAEMSPEVVESKQVKRAGRPPKSE